MIPNDMIRFKFIKQELLHFVELLLLALITAYTFSISKNIGYTVALISTTAL